MAVCAVYWRRDPGRMWDELMASRVLQPILATVWGGSQSCAHSRRRFYVAGNNTKEAAAPGERSGASIHSFTILSRSGWREAVATADRRNFQVERGVFGVAAFVNEIVGSLMRGENSDEPRVFLVGLAEVGTESALTFMNCRHKNLLRSISLLKV